jgi:hypothetical protein
MSFKNPIGGTLSITDVVQTVNLFSCKHLLLVNDGNDEVYIRIEQYSPFSNTTTTSDFNLKAGEAFTLDSENSAFGFEQINLKCATAETASLRYKTWY